MGFRQLVRGRPSTADLEPVVDELAARYGHADPAVRFLEADNWLSTPLVLDDELFVKVISRRNTLVHALFTTGRNLGAFSSGVEGFFQRFESPHEMAEHELDATRRMRDLGVNAPEPIEALEIDGYGVVVLEYLPEFRPLDELDRDREQALAPELFAALRTLHDAGLAHGDLRAENVLILDGELYFIDATNVSEDGEGGVRSYDLACAFAALEPLIGAGPTVEAALGSYSPEEILSAVDFLDFVNIRPDHDFDAAAVRGEIEKRALEGRRLPE